MENKIVLFANLKGGVGKTSLCAHLANWMTERGRTVTVIDADVQQSMVRFRAVEMNDRDGETIEAPWNLMALNTSDASSAEAFMKTLKNMDGTILIDCPGNLDAAGMLPILRYANLIIVPFSYDDIAMDTTGLFVRVACRVSGAQLAFIPNRINLMEGTKADKQSLAEDLDILATFGDILPLVRQSVHVKRFSTLNRLTADQHTLMDSTFEAISKLIDRQK